MSELETLGSALALLADPKAMKAKLDQLLKAVADAAEAKKTMAQVAAFKVETEAAIEEMRSRHDAEMSVR